MIVDWIAAVLVGALVGSMITDALWRGRWRRDVRDGRRKLDDAEQQLAELQELIVPMRRVFDKTRGPADAAQEAHDRARVVPFPRRRSS